MLLLMLLQNKKKYTNVNIQLLFLFVSFYCIDLH